MIGICYIGNRSGLESLASSPPTPVQRKERGCAMCCGELLADSLLVGSHKTISSNLLKCSEIASESLILCLCGAEQALPGKSFASTAAYSPKPLLSCAECRKSAKFERTHMQKQPGCCLYGYLGVTRDEARSEDSDAVLCWLANQSSCPEN